MKLSTELKQNLGLSHGVQVQGMKNGLFQDGGMKDGFIILYINDEPVNNADDVEYLYNMIMKNSGEEKVMFITGIYPTGKKGYYAIDLSQE